MALATACRAAPPVLSPLRQELPLTTSSSAGKKGAAGEDEAPPRGRLRPGCGCWNGSEVAEGAAAAPVQPVSRLRNWPVRKNS